MARVNKGNWPESSTKQISFKTLSRLQDAQTFSSLIKSFKRENCVFYKMGLNLSPHKLCDLKMGHFCPPKGNLRKSTEALLCDNTIYFTRVTSKESFLQWAISYNPNHSESCASAWRHQYTSRCSLATTLAETAGFPTSIPDSRPTVRANRFVSQLFQN